RFAATVPTRLQPVDCWKAAVRQLEDLGFSSVAMADHFTDGYAIEPMVALTAAAMCSSRLHLLTAVLGNDYRHPVLVHRMAAALDVLSEGRLELGLGAGWMVSDYEAAGIPYDPPGERVSRMEEAIHVIKGLFGPEPFSWAGKHYSICVLDGLPKPVQQPHPPLLIGGGGKRVLRLAGREAQIIGINANLRAGSSGTHSINDFSGERIAEKIGWVKQGAEAAGRRFDDLELYLGNWLVRVDESPSETEPFLERIAARVGLDPAWIEQAPGVLVGPPGRCVEKLLALRESFGFSYVHFDPGPRSMASIESVAPIVARLAGT
ncbi:MAG TPA: TIGR03621 family F420-dependent LLM class oxidoreductase, partial [Acidimicrobiales bacterium]|nr:TIGR03621 family F420-dependent LLM class oxidoreductase [Acidimicrobiales bacterium]